MGLCFDPKVLSFLVYLVACTIGYFGFTLSEHLSSLHEQLVKSILDQLQTTQFYNVL